MEYSGITANVQYRAMPYVPDETFSGPIYCMDRWEWQVWKRPGDKAIVVIRDPRDRLISEIYSQAYSHESTPRVELHREMLLRLSSLRDQVSYGIAESAVFSRFYLSWSDCRDESAMLVRYEDLVHDQCSEYSRVLEWLGWEVPKDTLEAVVDRLSFEKRSGRQVGDTDIFSHYRRGVAGDWENHFDRLHGKLWEDLYPGLLEALGYEQDSHWWRSLSDPAELESKRQSQQTADEKEILRKRNELLEQQLREKENEIQRQAAVVNSLKYQASRARITCPDSPDTIGRVESNASSQLEAKEWVIQEQAARLRTLEAERNREHEAASRLSRTLDRLKETVTHELQAKEQVIQKQDRVLRRHAVVSTILGLSMLERLRQHAVAVFRPRLGNLKQYPPREMRRLPDRSPRIDGYEHPSISVVTPSLSQGRYLERTLRSVLDQDYPNLEYHVQDGGSKDRTVDVLECWQERLTGWRSEPDRGQSDAINRAFMKTSGEIMGWLNADDLLLPGALHCVADYFSRHPEVDVVYGNRLIIDENDKEIGYWILPRHDDGVLSWVDFVPQETLFWRRRIWEKAGARVDESFRFAMDWDLLIRFREAGARFSHIDRFLGAFRIHGHQKTTATINDIGHREMDRIRERCLGRVPKQVEIRRAVAPYMTRHVTKHLLHRMMGG